MAEGILQNPYLEHQQVMYQHQTNIFEIKEYEDIPEGIDKSLVPRRVIVSPSEILFTFSENRILSHISSNYSSEPRKFYQSLFFSIFKSALLLEIGYLTTKLDNIMRIILGGGVNIKYYNLSYYTSDIDLKVFPKDYSNPRDFKQELINEFDRIKLRMKEIAPILAQNYLDFIYKLIRKFPHEQYIKDYVDYFKKSFDINKNFDFEFSIPPHRRGESDDMYKFTVIYNSTRYSLMDVVFYNKDNATSSLLHNKIMMMLTEDSKKDKLAAYKKKIFSNLPSSILNDTDNATPPTTKIMMGLKDSEDKILLYHFYINNYSYILHEKSILYNDLLGRKIFNSDLPPRTIDYLKQKFLRSLHFLLTKHYPQENIFLKKYLKYKFKYISLKKKYQK